tara:strand:- start:2373 stop:2789 length:417 start_codon:yes stop_codon:yes gene_type:complete
MSDVKEKVAEVVDSVKEPLEVALIDIVQSSVKAKDFLVSELPEVVEQLLMWQFWYNLIWFVGSVGVLFFSWKQIKKLYKNCRDDNWKDDNVVIPNSIGMILLGIPFLIALVEGINLVWLQIWVAPKVYLIEYLTSLTK